MCGLAGVFSKSDVDASVIEAMTQSLLHRGPDAKGVFFSESKKIALGHTRLSIIDLSVDANQPFHSRDGRYTVVFNGEIYNFQHLRDKLQKDHGLSFRTNSDTEVIAEGFSCWGPAFAEKLDGMFAIAIADRVKEKIFLCRDRLGKKPLYYWQSDQLFAFASEIKSLLRHPVIRQHKKADKEIISTFLHLGYIPEPHTAYVNIKKFPAAHFGEIDRALKLTTTSYWQMERIDKSIRINSIDEARSQLGSLLHRAVEKRLIADVPLGAFLSGGTDSSLVAAYATKNLSHKLKTFNIGFNESKHDERSYARKVADHLQTEHTEYVLSEREASGVLETYIQHFDEPFADTSAIPVMLVSKLARKEVKVALTGDGGDELFQGYGSYTWADRLDSFTWKIGKPFLRQTFETFGNSRLKRIARLLEPVNAGGIRSHIFSQEQYFFSQQEIKDNLLRDSKSFHPFEYHDLTPSMSGITAGERQALFDLRFYLKDDLLVKVDRASMFYGLECRSPFLDHRVVEFALALDKTVKKRHGESKWILKQMLSDFLPKELVYRPKWGFSIPLANWLKGDLRYLIIKYLDRNVIEQAGLFRESYVTSLVQKFLKGDSYLYNRLWVLIIVHKWLLENDQ
jgi:asparagine synthase (glutamine-hydrolysing)